MSQTRSKTVAENNGMERILEEISEKLSTLCSKCELFTTAFQNMEEQTRLYRENVELLLSSKTEFGNNITVENCANDLPVTNAQEIFKEWSEINLEKEAYKKRNQMKQHWFRLLNERKQAFWNALKHENLADFYEMWKAKENIIFPRKFRIKPIDGEPKEETQIRINLAIQKFETEITLLRLRVSKYRAKFEKCDETMMDEINQRSTGKIREKLTELWTQEVTREEEKSKRILDTKTTWLQQYEENYGNEPAKPRRNQRHFRETRRDSHKRRNHFDTRFETRPLPRARSQTPDRTYAEIVKQRPATNNRRNGPGIEKCEDSALAERRMHYGRNQQFRPTSSYPSHSGKQKMPVNHHFLDQRWTQKKRKKREMTFQKRR